jgi:tRNA dimethylallyltransferase
MNPGAIVITGPTACGKSDLALEIARRFPIEIVSVDSAQVYRGMDIGTAKPEKNIQDEIPHHLLDIRDPSNAYSAADFRKDAISQVEDIQARGKIPMLVGGTMLYLKALKEGMATLPPADENIRAVISDMAATQGWSAVHEKLKTVDPESAQRINPNDSQRLQRALEVYEITGKTLTAHHQLKTSPSPFDLFEIAIMPPDRAALHMRIEARFDKMLASGFLAEVQSLYDRGDLDENLPSIKAVGYKQAWSHIQGNIDYATMRETAIIATRQLAKRQYTWLRSWKDLHVIESADVDEALKILQSDSILRLS